MAQHFAFDDQQAQQAEKAFTRRREQLQWYLRDHGEEIEQYFRELDRLEKAEQDEGTRDIAFQRDWIANKSAELRGQLGGWLRDLKELASDYQSDLHALADPEQLRRGNLALSDPGAMWVDFVVKYLILGVGMCLILGLFTRGAAVAGALFLFSVISAQPPWVYGAEETFYPTAEMLALLVLAATGAGRFAGLDFFIHSLRMRCCPPKHGT